MIFQIRQLQQIGKLINFSNLTFFGMRIKILNSKILECQTENVKKFDKFFNFPNCNIPIISEIVQFRKLENFHILKICKTIKISKTSNSINYHICILSVCRILKNVKFDFRYFYIRNFGRSTFGRPKC